MEMGLGSDSFWMNVTLWCLIVPVGDWDLGPDTAGCGADACSILS